VASPVSASAPTGSISPTTPTVLARCATTSPPSSARSALPSRPRTTPRASAAPSTSASRRTSSTRMRPVSGNAKVSLARGQASKQWRGLVLGFAWWVAHVAGERRSWQRMRLYLSHGRRPGSVVWLCAPIAKLVSRAFDIVREKIEDYRLPVKRLRDTQQERMIELENGARIEGVSMENIWSAAGASVDYAIIDEAAQIEDLAWSRGIQPVLLDRGGQALMISSFEGREGVFFERYEESQGRQDGVWEAFTGRTADNFFIAPQGDLTPALVEAKRTTDPIDYMEQYGGIPAHAKFLVYPEFKERVHVGHYPFDPGHPVILAGDPASGANEYAVLAIQDYPELRRVHVIDEIYQRGGITESVLIDVGSRSGEATS
jgi:hypothetical protein